MNAVVENLTSNKVKLTITIPQEDFAQKVTDAYRKLAPRISIPGFRKGKAPRKIIEAHYGGKVFLEEAFSDNCQQYYEGAVTQRDLHVVNAPDINLTTLEYGSDLVFTAEVYVRPEVTLPPYDGIEVVQVVYNVTDDDVGHEVGQAMERIARWADVDGPAAAGDRLTMDYAGEIGGEPFEGGSAEGMTLELGSGTFIPGFEEQLIGVAADESKELIINATFPEDYRASELSGKEAVFRVKVKEVRRKELPELDDELAKDVSDFDTLDEYRADIRKRLEEQAERRREDEQQTLIVNAIAEKTECDVPEVMVDNEINAYINNMARSMAMRGIRLEQWLEYTGKTMEELREEDRETARKRVMQSLVVDKVKAIEDVEVTDEALNEEINIYAGRARRGVEEYRADLSENELEGIKDMLKVRATLKLLEGKATFSGVEERRLRDNG